jgi:hypothetical protein
MRIIVAEFPKSGGSWFVSMLGDALSLPKKDLYTNNKTSFCDPTLHPWYKGADSWDLPEACVIKSHEFPNTKLHSFPAALVHLIRDCRDVVVSRYFFSKDFLVNNGLLTEFNYSFEEHAEESASGWTCFVSAWRKEPVITVLYEDLLRDPSAELRRVFEMLGVPVSDRMINFAVQNNTKEKMHAGFAETFKHNTFVRKGIAGDWINFFDDRVKDLVKKHAGHLLISLGYAENDDW